jgi:hypothetical protein
VKLPATMRDCLLDAYGRPVPYVNIWSGEMPEDRWIITYDVGVGRPGIAVPRGCRGVGVPDFTRAAPDRQRECMTRKRCQICRRSGAEWVVLSDKVSTRTIEIAGKATLTFTEPWLCKPCADFAVRGCPELLRRTRDEDLMLVRPVDFTLGWSSGWMEGPLEEETKASHAAMWGEMYLHTARDERGRRIKPVLAPS